MFIVLNVRDGTKSKYPSIVFLSIFEVGIPHLVYGYILGLQFHVLCSGYSDLDLRP